MLIIGHRGAAGIAPENTLEALRAGVKAGANMLEFDVRLTRDGVPILHHDFHVYRTHKKVRLINSLSLQELQSLDTEYPIVTLEKVLGEFFGHIRLNIECKQKSAAIATVQMIQSSYITQPDDWDNCLFSSFNATALRAIRAISANANIALLQSINPLAFTFHHRSLRLAGVGFHRLFMPRFALNRAKHHNLFTYAYTVNSPKTALTLQQRGIDGIVTNYPNSILGDIDNN